MLKDTTTKNTESQAQEKRNKMKKQVNRELGKRPKKEENEKRKVKKKTPIRNNHLWLEGNLFHLRRKYEKMSFF